MSRILAAVEEEAASAAVAARVCTIAILCDNESGVLSRVTGTLSARGFNIDSLTVSPTNIAALSRVTVVMSGVSEQKASQALKQLSDIVSVWAVVDYSGTNHLTRELVMVKVAYLPPPLAEVPSAVGYSTLIAAQPHRAAVRDVGTLFGAEVVDVGTHHITFQLTSWSKLVWRAVPVGNKSKGLAKEGGSFFVSLLHSIPPPPPPSPACLRRVEAFVASLQPFGIIETARSGVVAMLRSPVAGTESIPMPHTTGSAADAAALPPG